MQKNVNRWRWGAMLVLAIALLCTGFAAMAAQPKIIDTVPGAVRDKQLQHRWASPKWQQQMLKHIKDPKKLEQAKKALADLPKEITAKPNKTEGIARYARLFTEGYVDAIATNGKVTVWSNDTAYGSLVFAPANDVMHPTAVSPLDWAAPYYATPMRFFGDYLYVNEDGSIWVFDCADPNNIGFVGYYDVSCWGGTPDFDVHGGYLSGRLRH